MCPRLKDTNSPSPTKPRMGGGCSSNAWPCRLGMRDGGKAWSFGDDLSNWFNLFFLSERDPVRPCNFHTVVIRGLLLTQSLFFWVLKSGVLCWALGLFLFVAVISGSRKILETVHNSTYKYYCYSYLLLGVRGKKMGCGIDVQAWFALLPLGAAGANQSRRMCFQKDKRL